MIRQDITEWLEANPRSCADARSTAVEILWKALDSSRAELDSLISQLEYERQLLEEQILALEEYQRNRVPTT